MRPADTAPPDENIRPWEYAIQFFAEGLKGFMKGFADMRSRLYLGVGTGKIEPNTKSFSDVITITWDAVNDPLIGIYMDKKRFGVNAHRRMMRFNATLSPLFILVQCFDFGMTPLQRILQWTLVALVADIMSTANAVSESKIWAGITPHSQQRGRLQLWKTLGEHAASAAGSIPIALMGLKDVLGITDYQIMIWGAVLFAPLTIFCRWLPSYARQRVDFTVQLMGENETEETYAEPPSFRESFAIVKHNRWFVMWTVVNFIRLIIPKTDPMFFYRFLLPKLRFRSKEYGAELLYSLKGAVIGIPCYILSPFAIQGVRLFGGKINFFKAHVILNIVMHASVYFVGYNSIPRLLYMYVLEFLQAILGMWAPVPHGMMEYEMLDYVEWKTGYRSEGMTMGHKRHPEQAGQEQHRHRVRQRRDAVDAIPGLGRPRGGAARALPQ